VWLGVMIGLNIQTSFLTPPFGFALFYLRGVAPPSVRTTEMYRGVIAFICLQLLALVIVGNYPSLVNYLPNRVSLTSETAPPPLNPKLQYCMEQYVTEQFAERGDDIRRAIETAKGLDYSYVPDKLRKQVEGSFAEAESAFGLLAKAIEGQENIDAQAVPYRPLHDQVRDIENEIRALENDSKSLEQTIRLARPDDSRQASREAALAGLKSEIASLKASIPADWDAVHKKFLSYVAAERTARNKYRRAADDAYEPIAELRDTIASTDALAALESDLRGLAAEAPGMEPEAAVERIQDERAKLGDIEGANAIRSLLTKARSAIKASTPDPQKMSEYLSDAIATYEEDLAWRKRALRDLKPGLDAYNDAIEDTIGLRGQPRLPHEQALYVASCSAGHRDISLSF